MDWTLVMLRETWVGIMLRAVAAAALAVGGFHAWRQLQQRARKASAASEDAPSASEPLLAAQDKAEQVQKRSQVTDVDAAIAVPTAAQEPAAVYTVAQAASAGTVEAAAAEQAGAQEQQDDVSNVLVSEAAVQSPAQLLPQPAVASAVGRLPQPTAGTAAQQPEAEQLTPTGSQPAAKAGMVQGSVAVVEEHDAAAPALSPAVPAAAQEQPPGPQANAQPARDAAESSQPAEEHMLMVLAAATSAQQQQQQQPAELAVPAEQPEETALASVDLSPLAQAQRLAPKPPQAPLLQHGGQQHEEHGEQSQLPPAGGAGAAHAADLIAEQPAGVAEQPAGGALSGAAVQAEQGEGEEVRDVSDVSAVPLGSPFVPPLLNAPPVPAIPLFSSFVPSPPLAAGDAAASGSVLSSYGAAEGAAPVSSPPSGAGEEAEHGAGSAGSGRSSPEGGPPRHRRRRSLLSLGLEEQRAEQAPAGEGPHPEAMQTDETQLVSDLAMFGQQGSAPGPGMRAAAADGSSPVQEHAPGRPVGLRVELPAESPKAAPAEPAPWSPQHDLQPPAAAARMQPEELSGHNALAAHTGAGGPWVAAPPAEFDMQQQQAVAAAAAAAGFFAGQQQQQHVARRLQSAAQTPDSVAAALQRAVELAASGPGSLGGPAASVSSAAGTAGRHGGGPLGMAPPGGYPGASGGPAGAGNPYAARSALAGGTFRAATAPAPIANHHHHLGGVGDSAWDNFSMLQERSASLARERHLPRLSEEIEGFRASVDVDVPLACKLDVVAGPCTNASYTNTEEVLEVIIGRNQGVQMQLNDGEVSGQHAAVRWSSVDKCWKVADLGSLNGTLLNGEPISVAGRKRGRDYRLSSDDILQLGSFTKIKVSTFPRDLLDPQQSRCGSLPVGSMPRSLTMPKHRIPSFTSLLSPKITNTPSKKATVAAASDELRLECCIISRTGRDHQRKGQTCEDVACAECPLHGSEAALEGSPAALFCVFDGHCGRAAADAASVALPDEVAARLAGVREPLAAAEGAESMLHRAFLAADEAIGAEEGCTATAVLMWRDAQGAVCLQAANVGDSAALFIDPDTGRAVELTEDHRLTNPRERQRLLDMGIQLASNARRLYGLNLCRGLGDKFLKDEDLGLSAEPHVSGVVRLTEQQGGILLIASDGLWDVTDADAVTAAVCTADREQDGNVLETTHAVIAHALKQRTKDDVTALVVRVWPAAEWELRSPTKNLDDGEAAAFVS